MENTNLSSELLNMLADTHFMIIKESFSEYWQGEMKMLSLIDSMKDEEVLPSELGSKLFLSSARIAAMLNSLEKKGLVKREMDLNDRRKILVSITDEGREYVKEKYEKLKSRAALLAEKLGEEDTRELRRLLQRLTEIYKEIKEERAFDI